MSGRTGLTACVAAVLLAGAGCVSCGADGYGHARLAAPDCEVPTCQRNQVHVFVIGGMSPAVPFTLEGFREELGRKGFAKVTTAQAVYAPWVAYEMRRVRKDEPNTVFVLVGTEGGTPAARWLAERAASKGVPVAGLVLFDRSGTPRPTGADLRTVTVSSAPTAPESVAVVAQLLNEVASSAPIPSSFVLESDYPYAPAPRPTIDPNRDPDWAFLFDDGAPPQPALAPVPAAAALGMPQPATTAAHR